MSNVFVSMVKSKKDIKFDRQSNLYLAVTLREWPTTDCYYRLTV